MQDYDIPLHDIKPILEVQEYSLYYFIGVVLLGSVLIFGLLFLFYKWFKNRNSFNQREEHFKLIEAINFTNTKKSAYEITLYGATFKEDSLRHTEMYKNMIDRLDEYKYKKEVDSFDEETLGYIELYKGMIDV